MDYRRLRGIFGNKPLVAARLSYGFFGCFSAADVVRDDFVITLAGFELWAE